MFDVKFLPERLARRSLRAQVLWLVLIFFLILLGFSVFAIISIGNAERQSQLRQIHAGARTLAAALDVHLRSIQNLSSSLASSLPRPGDGIPQLYARGKEISQRHKVWLVLADAQGKPIFHTRREFGAELKPLATEKLAAEAARSGNAQLSEVILGNVAERPIFVIWAP
jgi:hypothetical protein